MENEKLRYRFKKGKTPAEKDAATFEAYRHGEITKAEAIYQIEKHNSQYMTPEQFDYYIEVLGYTQEI